jgi:hypothetical protein
MMSDQRNTVLLPRIESRIQVIRGLRVILDVDLAALYGCRPNNIYQPASKSKMIQIIFTSFYKPILNFKKPTRKI